MNWSKHISLIVGLTIPVIMIVAVAISIYVPQLSAKPITNFVYAVGTYPVYSEYTDKGRTVHSYRVTDNHLQETVVTTPYAADQPDSLPYRQVAPQFWLYDVTKHTSQEMTADQIKALQLDPKTTSPDGFKVERGGYSDFPFGGSSISDWFLVGHNASFKLSLQDVSTNQYDTSVLFVGWVK